MNRRPHFSLRRLLYWFTASIVIAYMLGDLGAPAFELTMERPWLVLAIIVIAVLFETLVSGLIKGFDAFLRRGLENESQPNRADEE